MNIKETYPLLYALKEEASVPKSRQLVLSHAQSNLALQRILESNSQTSSYMFANDFLQAYTSTSDKKQVVNEYKDLHTLVNTTVLRGLTSQKVFFDDPVFRAKSSMLSSRRVAREEYADTLNQVSREALSLDVYLHDLF